MQQQRPTTNSRNQRNQPGASPTIQSRNVRFDLREPKPLQYYQDAEKRVLRTELLDEKAKKWATDFLSSEVKLKTTQLRRFYDELKTIERKILIGKEISEWNRNFDRDRALIVMLKAKALYAEKRKNSPREFTEFIFDHVASLEEFRDFQAFLKVFEAVVAFHRYFSDDK